MLIVAQPTRGLDVGSIEFIHRRIVEMRDAGAAVLLVSAELDEIFTLADRIGVLYRGRLVGESTAADATRHRRVPDGQRPADRRGGGIDDATVGAPVGATPHEGRLPAARPARYFDLQPILVPICAILLAFAVGSVVILLVGENPLDAYWALLRGMFGSWDRVAASLGRSTPFIGAALAVAFAFRAGLFNIGVEGQLLVGATVAAWVGTWDVVARPARPSPW